MTGFPFPKPNVPDPEHRLPFIFKQFVDPCDAPITVWAQALWPAFRDALIVWYQVDLIQVIRTMWRPPLMGWRLRGGRHGGRGGTRSKKGALHRIGKTITFDPNDFVGDALNPFADEEMVMLLPGEVIFWTGIDVIVLLAFEYQIFDLTTQFLYEWTAAVARSKYCQARDDAVLLARSPGYPLLGIFGWDAVGLLDAVKMRHIDFFNGFGASQSVGPGVVGISFGYQNNGGGIGPAWLETRLQCLTGPRAGIYATQRVSTGDGAGGKGGCTYDCMSGEVWIGEIRVNGSYFISEPSLFMHARGSAGP